MDAPRLHFVSGKGGVGRSLIAAAMARAYAENGRKTILISYDVPGKKHQVFNAGLSYQAVQVRRNLDLMCLDAQSALEEYVRRNMAFSAVYTPVLKNDAVRRFLRALPIFDELITLGKIYDLTTHETSPYDQVVVDGPATGHCKVILQVAEVAAATLAAGPIYSNSIKIRDMLKDPALSELVIVTLPEATPAREALELHDFARDTGLITCNRILVNRYIESEFHEAELDEIRLAAETFAGAQALWAATQLHEQVAREHALNVKSLEGSQVTVTCLPELSESQVAARVKEMVQLLSEAMRYA